MYLRDGNSGVLLAHGDVILTDGLGNDGFVAGSAIQRRTPVGGGHWGHHLKECVVLLSLLLGYHEMSSFPPASSAL